MRFFDGAAVDGRLAYPELVDTLEATFRKGAIAPLRHHHAIALDGRPEATLLLMPAWEASAPGGQWAGRYLGVKSVTVFPDNAARGKPAVLDLTQHVRGGAKNDFLIIATNTAGAEGKPNPAGAWFFLDATYGKDVLDNKGREAGDLFTDAKWEASADGGKTWTAAVDVGGVNVAPWKLAEKLPSAWAVEPPGEVRAALLYADPLTTALGRPNREQVNTVRPTAAALLSPHPP